MIQAYPKSDGNFLLRGKTYHYRHKIKALGGKWDGKQWIVPASVLAEVHAVRMYQARVNAACHNPEEIIWVSEYDIKRGFTNVGCGFCDRSMSEVQAQILEVSCQSTF